MGEILNNLVHTQYWYAYASYLGLTPVMSRHHSYEPGISLFAP